MADALGDNVFLLVLADPTHYSSTFIDTRLKFPFTATGNIAHVSSPIDAISFDGTGDGLMNSGIFHPGALDCTLECFYRPATLPTSDDWPTTWYNCQVAMGWGTPSAGDGFNLCLGQTQIFAQQNNAKVAAGTHGMTTGTLYHLCMERYGTTLKTYVDGVEKGSYTIGTDSAGGGSGFYIGSEAGQGAWLNGYAPGFRYTLGARYQGAFTAPTSFELPDPCYIRLISPKTLNPWFGGAYRLAGTVSRLGAVGVYRVHLYDHASGMLLAETWSAADGSYAFEGLDYRPNGYYAVAYDHTGAPLNAAIADLLTPVAIA